MKLFLVAIGNTLKKISSFILLLFLFSFTYAILGLELFANKVRFNLDGETVGYFDPIDDMTSNYTSIPDANFDTFIGASLSVFVVLTGDNWATLYFD